MLRDIDLNGKNIGIVTFPLSKAGSTPLSNLVEIICACSNNSLFIITGNAGSSIGNLNTRIRVFSIFHKIQHNILNRIIAYINVQIQICRYLHKLKKSVDVWLFFIGGELLILPLIFAKITQKPVVLLCEVLH